LALTIAFESMSVIIFLIYLIIILTLFIKFQKLEPLN